MFCSCRKLFGKHKYYFFFPSLPRVRVWWPEFILSDSYWAFLLWKSAISSSRALLWSSTTLFSSATVACEQSIFGLNISQHQYIYLEFIKLGVKVSLSILQLSLLLLDSQHELLSHLLLSLVQTRQVTLSSHRVRLSEAARLSWTL